MAGDGRNTSWPFSWPIQSADQVRVIWRDADGADTTLSASVYSLALTNSGRSGGIVTYPLAGRLFTEVLGEDYPDRVQNLWNLWWVKTALLVEHAGPFHTDRLFYPYGADLYFHTLNLPLALITLPAQLLFGLVAAYNFGSPLTDRALISKFWNGSLRVR